MWHTGSIMVKKEVFHYWVKSYDEPSRYGIKNGRISKLLLTSGGVTAISYDRGWETRPGTENAELALAILLKEYN